MQNIGVEMEPWRGGKLGGHLADFIPVGTLLLWVVEEGRFQRVVEDSFVILLLNGWVRRGTLHIFLTGRWQRLSSSL